MSFRINMLAEPKKHRCDGCDEHKQVRFSVTHESHPDSGWHLCFNCFRSLTEHQLHERLVGTATPAGRVEMRAK